LVVLKSKMKSLPIGLVINFLSDTNTSIIDR
jgi:hypothetical protein